MRAEFYIAQVVRWNAPLRQVICQWLNIFSASDDPEALLAEFRGDWNLTSMTSQLGCARDEVFQYLRTRLAERLGVSVLRPVSKLGPADVAVFFDDEYVRCMSELLDCAQEWPVIAAKLFDLTTMRRLLDRAGIVSSHDNAPAERLLWQLMSPDGREKLFQYLGGAPNIWSVLTSLIEEKASVKLRAALGCEQSDIFAAVLERCEHSQAEEVPDATSRDDSQRLDVLGVARFREMLRAIGKTYSTVAEAHSQQLRASSSGNDNLHLVPAWFEYYINRSYRRALQMVVMATRPVGSIGFELERPTAEPYHPEAELRARIEQDGNATQLVIEFRTATSTQWHNCVRLVGRTEAECQHVSKHLPSTAKHLNGSGETLVSQILSSMIPTMETNEDKQWQQMLATDDALAQFFVLSNRQIPDVYSLGDDCQTAGTAFDYSERLHTVCREPRELFKECQRAYADLR
jgi:hypothetical protein